MKFFVLFVCALLLGISAYYVYLQNFAPKKNQVKTTPTIVGEPFTVEEPPSQALKGVVTSWRNEVFKKGRISTESAELKDTDLILQGEEIETGEAGEMVITFPDAALINVEPESIIEFGQTLPLNILINQKQGTVTYEKMSDIPLSIRSRRLLIDIEDEATVSLEEKNPHITVEAVKDDVTLAFNDSENVSTIFTIKEGETATFDNDERIVVEE